MKKILSITVLLIAAFTISNTITAQALKFGHINTAELVKIMPQTAEATKEMEKAQLDAQEVIKALEVEYERKAMELETQKDTLSEFVLKAKQDDLVSIQQRWNEYQQGLRQTLMEKEQELFAPIQETALNAIKEVANEGGYIYIFDAGQMLHIGEQSEDVMQAVKTKLGIQ